MDAWSNRIKFNNKNVARKEVLIISNDCDSASFNEIMDAASLDNETDKKVYCIKGTQSEVIPECPSRPIRPRGKQGPLVVKIPVIISELKVKINCAAVIRFDFPAVELKRIKRKVFLSEYKMIPECNKLFISGYVRTNIEYASTGYSNSRIGNNIRHMILNLPFKGVTDVDYFVPPIVYKDEESADSEMIDEETLVQNYHSSESINSEIYCELVKTEIDESYIVLDNDSRSYKSGKIFKSMSEKMVLKLTLRLMQDQCVLIDPDAENRGIED